MRYDIKIKWQDMSRESEKRVPGSVAVVILRIPVTGHLSFPVCLDFRNINGNALRKRILKVC